VILLSTLKENKALLLIVALAMTIRVLFLTFYKFDIFPDALAYDLMGEEIFSGKIPSNHIYMPLYPIYTFITGLLKAQILIDITLSSLSIVFIYKLSILLFENKNGALAASFIYACYPHSIFYANVGLTETMFVFFLLASFYYLYSKKILLSFLFLTLNVLVKPTFYILNPLLIIIFIKFFHKYSWKKTLKYLSIYSVMYCLLLTPWWIMQYQKYGEFIHHTLADGVVLYAGNNSMNKTGGGITDVDFNEEKFVGLSPIETNRLQKKLAIEFIKQNHYEFIVLSGKKFIRFWRLWPYTDKYQQSYIFAASLLSYGLVLFLSIIFFFSDFRKKIRATYPILIMFLYLNLVHLVTISSIRYRFPIEPFLIIFASIVLAKNNIINKFLSIFIKKYI